MALICLEDRREALPGINAPDRKVSETVVTILSIRFGVHVDLIRVQGIVSGIAAYGNVYETENKRAFRVDVFRPSKLPSLKERLIEWDRYGFLTWEEVP